MADRFFDTSAAKHGRAEVGTARVDALLAEAGARHPLSGLSVVESYSVFARLARTGQVTAADFHLARGRLDVLIALLTTAEPKTDIYWGCGARQRPPAAVPEGRPCRPPLYSTGRTTGWYAWAGSTPSVRPPWRPCRPTPT
jgi:hypothetical protein